MSTKNTTSDNIIAFAKPKEEAKPNRFILGGLIGVTSLLSLWYSTYLLIIFLK